MELNATSGSPDVRLSGDLTIYTALDDKNALVALLNDRPALELDLAGVAECDTAGLQLLILLKVEAERRRLPLRVTASSPAVESLVRLYRLEDFFGLQSA